MPNYTVRLNHGGIGIIWAVDLRYARKIAYDRSGRDNVASVKKSTEAEINWVRSMGGAIPKGPWS